MQANLWHRFFLLFALLSIAVSPSSVRAQFNFTTNNNTITITWYSGPGGDVTIPATINGLPVARIGGFAFSGRTDITAITIPNSVTRIGDQAFYACTGLTGVTLPSSVTNVGNGIFSACTNLLGITVDVLNLSYSSVAGVVFNKDQTQIIQFPAGRIGPYTIPSSVTSIRDLAFSDCVGLTSATIPEGTASIGNSAFAGCTALASISLPNSTTNLGSSVLLHCHNLASVTLGTNMPSIGNWTFAYCSNLTSITVPSSITNIGSQAFYSCKTLAAITVDPLNSAYSSVDGVLFNSNQTMLITFPAGKGGAYTPPNSVTTFGPYAFASSGNLTNVVIPDSVIDIANYAFAQCVGLTSVTIPASVANIGWGIFSSCSNLTKIYFEGNTPSKGSLFDNLAHATNATVYFLPGTANWGATFADCPTALWLPQTLIDDSNFGTQTNQFGLCISWANGKSVIVEASTNLTDPNWSPLTTNTLVSGLFHFSDLEWTNHPARFYRIRSP